MTHRTYCLVVGVLFLLIAILQCLRVVFGWPVAVNGVSIPMWVSGVAAVVLGYLSFIGLRLSGQAR
jgi:hypothetical protein